jgi:hypothetical protein
VSLADARAAASTANNFRERHGDQITAGWKSASGLNQKYGVTEKLQSFSNSSVNDIPTDTKPVLSPKSVARDNILAAKNPPPPPPKKKAALRGVMDTGPEPPPLPLASKPKSKVSNW